jgi:hypothetical protein
VTGHGAKPTCAQAPVTFAWAVAPTDAEDGDSLLSHADQRLLANKRAAKQLV